MKKIVLLGIGSVLLSGCTQNNTDTIQSSTQEPVAASSSESSETQVYETSSETQVAAVTFDNTVLTTPEGIFTLTGSKSNESEDGDKSIFVTFDYQNTTEENQNIEFLI